jgi:hypothetical protein
VYRLLIGELAAAESNLADGTSSSNWLWQNVKMPSYGAPSLKNEASALHSSNTGIQNEDNAYSSTGHSRHPMPLTLEDCTD